MSPVRFFLIGLSLMGLVAPMRVQSADSFRAKCDQDYAAARFREAARCYSEACLRNPFDSESFYRWGLCLYRLGEKDGSRSCFARALALQPGHAYARVMLERTGGQAAPARPSSSRGVEHFRKGWYSAAAMEFTRAVLEDPGATAPRFNLAVTYYKMGWIKASERETAKCLSINPNHAGARYLQGVLYEVRGDRERALAEFRELASLHPDETFAVYARERFASASAELSNRRLHGGFQSFTGWREESGAPVAPSREPGGISQEFSTQLGWNPGGRLAGCSLYAAAGLALRDREVGLGRSQWKNVGLLYQPAVRSGIAWAGSVDFMRSTSMDHDRYDRTLLTVGLQKAVRWFRSVQASLRWTLERYGATSEMNASSPGITLTVRRPLGGKWFAVLSSGAWWNRARDKRYNYRALDLSGSVTPPPWRRVSCLLGFQVQSAGYGNGLVDGVDRWVRSQGVYMELRRPISASVHWTAGAGFWAQKWDVGRITSRSGRLYTGVQCFF